MIMREADVASWPTIITLTLIFAGQIKWIYLAYFLTQFEIYIYWQLFNSTDLMGNSFFLRSAACLRTVDSPLCNVLEYTFQQQLPPTRWNSGYFLIFLIDCLYPFPVDNFNKGRPKTLSNNFTSGVKVDRGSWLTCILLHEDFDCPFTFLHKRGTQKIYQLAWKNKRYAIQIKTGIYCNESIFIVDKALCPWLYDFASMEPPKAAATTGTSSSLA